MTESITSWAAPYGGTLFLVCTALAVATLGALWHAKGRLAAPQLRRVMRVVALAALAGSWAAMQQGEHYLATALLVLLWGILMAIVCAREIASRR